LLAGYGQGRRPELAGGGLIRSLGGWAASKKLRLKGQDRPKGDERILGKLSKIDGAISRDEIAVVQKFINSLQMPEAEKEFARRVFKEARDSPHSIEDFSGELYRTSCSAAGQMRKDQERE
jgi:hypothetical protein